VTYFLAHRYIGYGDAGILQTVDAMFSLMRDGARVPIVQEYAGVITQDATNPYGQALAIRQWVADRWTFRDDPDECELLYSAEAQLKIFETTGRLEADCDDAAILIGSLGRASGLEVRVICVGFLTNDAPYTHTWVELRPPLGVGVWVEGDVTRSMQSIPMDRIGRAAAWSLPT
jgi:transglutaminase-like putative cysteine protease